MNQSLNHVCISDRLKKLLFLVCSGHHKQVHARDKGELDEFKQASASVCIRKWYVRAATFIPVFTSVGIL